VRKALLHVEEIDFDKEEERLPDGRMHVQCIQSKNTVWRI